MTWVANEAVTRHHALHNPGELAILLALLESAGPHSLLEIGTWAGGAAWAFSRVGSIRHIVTVDAAPQPEAAATVLGLPCQGTLIVGDSGAPDTTAHVARALGGEDADVLVIDGAHDYESARRDFDLYARMVRPGGLVVIHDTQGHPDSDRVEVPKLWGEVRLTHRTTELVSRPGGPCGTGIVWL